jgi:hypothetical protein
MNKLTTLIVLDLFVHCFGFVYLLSVLYGSCLLSFVNVSVCCAVSVIGHLAVDLTY